VGVIASLRQTLKQGDQKLMGGKGSRKKNNKVTAAGPGFKVQVYQRETNGTEGCATGKDREI